jgi:hypothetical protein
MRIWFGALALFVSLDLLAAIPATPVMTVYKFNGPMDVPYYDADRFASRHRRRARRNPGAGHLAHPLSDDPQR